MKPDIEQHIVYNPSNKDEDIDHLLLNNKVDIIINFF